MKGIQSDIIQYVCESDRESLPQEQTIWHLKVLSVRDRLPITNAYAKAMKSDSIKGQTSFDEDKMWKAKRNEWLAVVLKVENYQFGVRNSELQAKGLMTVETPQEIALILDEIPNDVAQEILDAANKGESEVFKKK